MPDRTPESLAPCARTVHRPARRLAAVAACAGLWVLAACTDPGDSRQAAPSVPVTTAVVERGDFTPTLTLLGVVEAAATAEAKAPASGLLRYPPRFAAGLRTGERVAEGETIASVEDPGVDLALAESRLARRSAEADLARQQRAFEAGVVPEAALDEARTAADLAALRLAAAEERARALALRAPASGSLVVGRSLPPGSRVEAGEVLARVALAGPARIVAQAPAAQGGLLAPGLPAELRPPGGEGPSAAAEVTEVDPEVGPGGALRVVLRAVPGGSLPAPGEGVEVILRLATRRATLSVPEEALRSAGGSAVFVVERRFSGPAALRRPVALGARSAGRVEVVQGLNEGDRVVVEGVALLTDGAAVVEVDTGGAGAARGGR